MASEVLQSSLTKALCKDGAAAEDAARMFSTGVRVGSLQEATCTESAAEGATMPKASEMPPTSLQQAGCKAGAAEDAAKPEA